MSKVRNQPKSEKSFVEDANQVEDSPIKKAVKVRTSMSIDDILLARCERIAFVNKQNKIPDKSVSELITNALNTYISKKYPDIK